MKKVSQQWRHSQQQTLSALCPCTSYYSMGYQPHDAAERRSAAEYGCRPGNCLSTGKVEDLLFQPLNDIIGVNVSIVFTGIVAVGQRFLNGVNSKFCVNFICGANRAKFI